MPTRRMFLVGTLALTVGGTAACSTARARPFADPFTLGVASGDPSTDGAVIWTRLAPEPLADDGLGGMPARVFDVDWEVAADSRFARVEQRGTVTADPGSAHSVHVELAGLQPGREYHYRFRAEGHLSPAGRTRTAPDASSMAPVTMCFASCAQFEHGWFTAYRRLAEENPDIVLHLGDYMYEMAAGKYRVAGGNVRDHAGPETRTLANYRQRYAQYKTDADLQAAHAAAPWLVVFDDHEVENNWADGVPEDPDPDFMPRRAAALQAYYENMPLRRTAKPDGGHMQLYRRVPWGAMATFHMLDTRQYRGDQPCGDEFKTDCPERTDPTRSITGVEQERWMIDGFRSSRARWDVLGQQVFFAGVELTPGPGRGYNPDAWDGYVGNRDRIIEGMTNSSVRNGVVLTGDIHSHWAAEIHERPDDLSSPTVATELVTTSIASGGDGTESRKEIEEILPENPHVKFFNNRRGYVRATMTADELRAGFQVVPYISRPGAPVETRATFVVEDRVPRLQRL